MKTLAAKLFQLLGWFVVYEAQLCDVMAWKESESGKIRLIGLEAERSTRNAIHNAKRDFERGADAVVVIATSERVRNRLRRELHLGLCEECLKRVALTTVSRVEQCIKRLERNHANQIANH